MSRHTPLPEDFVEQQRRRLEALRADLLGPAAARENERAEEHSEEVETYDERAQELVAKEIDQAIHDVDERRLSRIERALEKISEGTYGFSDVSGAPIPPARLQAVPEALLTVAEEEAAEQRNRR
jgi:DnaK suppressor protein